MMMVWFFILLGWPICLLLFDHVAHIVCEWAHYKFGIGQTHQRNTSCAHQMALRSNNSIWDFFSALLLLLMSSSLYFYMNFSLIHNIYTYIGDHPVVIAHTHNKEIKLPINCNQWFTLFHATSFQSFVLCLLALSLRLSCLYCVALERCAFIQCAVRFDMVHQHYFTSIFNLVIPKWWKNTYTSYYKNDRILFVFFRSFATNSINHLAELVVF